MPFPLMSLSLSWYMIFIILAGGLGNLCTGDDFILPEDTKHGILELNESFVCVLYITSNTLLCLNILDILSWTLWIFCQTCKFNLTKSPVSLISYTWKYFPRFSLFDEHFLSQYFSIILHSIFQIQYIES